MIQINKKLLKIVPAGLYWGLIWYVSSQEVSVNISGYDKLIHTIEYGLLGFLLAFGFSVNPDNLKQGWVNFAVAAPVLGIIDEVHQLYVPGREASFGDLFADITGCVIGLIFFLILSKFIKKFMPNP